MSRKKFHEWASACACDMRKDGDGYIDPVTAGAWLCWRHLWHSDVSPLTKERDMLRARVAELEKDRERLLGVLSAVNATTFSHVDGRDLLAELHPRYLIDIKRRVDGRETWFEGDWLTRLYEAIKKARQAIGAAMNQEGE